MKFGAKEWLALLLSILLLTDITIFLNIPILRQVLAFLCFTTVPGLLILHILKLNEIEFLKKFVLSIGLSIAFLMFVGLLLNQLYLAVGFSKPLSTSSLVISFTIILTILSFIAYKRNKEDLDLSGVSNIRFDLKKNQFISPLLFPIIFPFLAVFGTYLMNTEGNNIILMVMLFLIPAYIVFVVYLRNRIPKITYPIAILAIGTALLLMHGLTSHYLNGTDVHVEYYAFRVVGYNLHWSMSNYPHVLTACLGTSLLPAIYWSLMDINQLYIYKLVYQIICALTPLVCYVIFKKYVNESYAFLAAFFFMAQMSFISGLQSAIRTELAILFFALAMMLFFDDEIDKLKKRILFILFMFAVIVSHYTTCYIFFFMILAFWLVTNAMQMPRKNPFKFKYSVTAASVSIFFAMIFFWYSQVTVTAFDTLTSYVSNTFRNLLDFYMFDERNQELISRLSGQADTIPDRITVVVHWITFIFMGIGVLSGIYELLKDKGSNRLNFDREYLLMMLFSIVVLILMVILPHGSILYGGNRLYQQCLVLLALGFVTGGIAIGKYARRPQLSLLIILIVLLSQFFCATYVVYQVFGVLHSDDLNREGFSYNKFYIHDQEVIGAKWLNAYGPDNPRIYTDAFGHVRLYLGYDKLPTKIGYFEQKKTIKDGYIYLRHANIGEQGVYLSASGEMNMTEYTYQFVGKSKIYNNGRSEVYT